jgi:hypothetical protein
VGVDAEGLPVIDPTQNVLDLVQAAIQRQDDLRRAESRHVREITTLRAEYTAELRRAEAARIDAIRAVDVGAVNRAAEYAAQQATILANQVSTSAEALRNQVSASDAAARAALLQALDPMRKDIADLRRAQYEALGGKVAVVESKDDRRESGIGVRAWIAIAIAGMVGFSSVVLSIAGIIIAIMLRG